MADRELVDTLKAVERDVRALLALALEEKMVERRSPRSLEQVLDSSGMSTSEIGHLLGESQRTAQRAVEGAK